MNMIENYNPDITNFIKYTIGNLNIAIVAFDERNSPDLYEVVKLTYSPFFAYMPKLSPNILHKDLYNYVNENKLDGAVCVYYPILDKLDDDAGFFAFFHEIGHIICNDNSIKGEIFADTFASDTMKKKINLKKCIGELFESTGLLRFSFKEYFMNIRFRNFLYKHFKRCDEYTKICANMYQNYKLRIKNMNRLNKSYS